MTTFVGDDITLVSVTKLVVQGGTIIYERYIEKKIGYFGNQRYSMEF